MKTDAKKRAAKRMAAEVFEAAKVPTPAKRKAKPLVGMPIHFCPTDQQRHFGPAERPLCSNYGPRYIGEVLAWGGANNPETVTCKECLRLYNVRNKMCRRCGTMITEVSVEKYQALCPKCKPQGLPKVGIVDVGADNKIERTWGKAQGREAELQAQLDKELELETLAKQEREQYNSTQREGIPPSTTEEQVMAKTEKQVVKAAAKVAKAGEDQKKAEKDLDGKKIKLLTKENPKRAGSKSFDLFKLYKNGMTVAQFKEAGGSAAAIAWDTDHNFIELY